MFEWWKSALIGLIYVLYTVSTPRQFVDNTSTFDRSPKSVEEAITPSHAWDILLQNNLEYVRLIFFRNLQPYPYLKLLSTTLYKGSNPPNSKNHHFHLSEWCFTIFDNSLHPKLQNDPKKGVVHRSINDKTFGNVHVQMDHRISLVHSDGDQQQARYGRKPRATL